MSEVGKEATIAVLNPGAFVGEECVSTVQPCRSATATALTDCVLLRIDKAEMIRILRDEPAVSAYFVTYLLRRSSCIQADLIDQHFNLVEKRLARTLLLLADLEKDDAPDALVPRLSQETLATMIGTTRSRVNLCLNRFRHQGFIEYDGQIRVKRTLLQVISKEAPLSSMAIQES